MINWLYRFQKGPGVTKDTRVELPDSNMFKHYSTEGKAPIPEGVTSTISFKTAEEFERERDARRVRR